MLESLRWWIGYGAAYDFDNGFTTAVGAQFTETGIMQTDETLDAYGLTLLTQADNYGVSVTYGKLKMVPNNDTYTALNGYYSFDNGFPS